MKLPVLCKLAGLCLFACTMATTGAAAHEEPTPDEYGVINPSIASSLPGRGDIGGFRKSLAARGITYSLYDTNDVLSNVHGGLKRGTIHQGKLELTLAVDLEKAVGWQGVSFFANGFDIHNTGRMRRDYVGGINTIAAIEGVPALRLSELWLESKLPGGAATLRVGQLAADVEFFFSALSTVFLQSDWATIAAANLPSGGPAYPLSTPGVRLKVDPTPGTSLLIAVFNGDPAGPGVGDEQVRNHHGLNFRVRDPALVMLEAQWRQNGLKADRGLFSQIKLGMWGHFGAFDDRRMADDGTLLADPAGSGSALRHRGNSGVYAVIEQQLYRPAGAPADGGVSAYSRVSGSPSDRNLIDLYVDGGIVVSGMVPGRPDDKFGAGMMYASFSDRVREFDRDVIRLTGNSSVVRDFEANLELNYQAQIVPGWLLQPTAQVVWHPNGDASRDAMVLGIRSFIHY